MNAPLPYAKHCEDRCKALRWQLQSFAKAIAKRCEGDCKALRLRRAKLSQISSVLSLVHIDSKR